MNRIKKILFSVIIGTAVLFGAAAPSFAFAEEPGNTAEPEKSVYLTTAADFKGFIDTLNSGEDYADTAVKLMGNIDIDGILSGRANGYKAAFSGVFDGQGYTLQNADGLNLFMTLNEGAVVRNLVVEIKEGYGSLQRENQSGVIAQICKGTIESCRVTGAVEPAANITPGGAMSYGGFAYDNKGTIQNCVSGLAITSGLATSSNAQFSAGIAVKNSGSIKNCLFTGKLIQNPKYDGKSGPPATQVPANMVPVCVDYGSSTFKMNGTVEGSYYLDTVYDAAGVFNDLTKHGTEKTDAELKIQATFEGWDFTNVWEMPADSYPVLRMKSSTGEQAEKGALQEAVNEAKLLAKELYTEDSWNTMQDELTKAEALLKKDDATQQEVNDQTVALKNAVAGLQQKYDKTSLEEKLKEAENIQRGDYENTSYIALREAANAAQTVLDKASTTQDEIDSQLESLSSAVNGLKVNHYTRLIEISTAEQFKALVDECEDSNSYENCKIVLLNDIDINGVQLREKLLLRKATFDGQGHTISGFNNPRGGLFWILQNGALLNVNLRVADGFTIADGEEQASATYGGILSSDCLGVISGCKVEGAVTYESGSLDLIYNKGTFICGISGSIGNNNDKGLIENCISAVDMTVLKDKFVSQGTSEDRIMACGIVKNINKTGMVRNCLTTGKIVAPSAYPVAPPYGGVDALKQAENCYFADTSVSVQGEDNQGKALDAENMKVSDNYKNWNFEQIWSMGDKSPELAALENGPKVSKTGLEAILLEAAAIKKGNYNDATWTALQTAITDGRAAADKADATQTEVDRLLVNLVNAINNLAEDINFGGLEKAIENGRAKATGIGQRTPETYKTLLASLETAQNANAKRDDYKYQSEVDALADSLNDAVSGLKDYNCSETVEIGSREDFAAFAANIKNNPNYTKDKCFVLTADIDISGLLDGYYGPLDGGIQFYGLFDGRGHTLSGYDGIRGLFSVRSSGVLKNMTLCTADNYRLQLSDYGDYNYYSGILGSNQGAVSNCQVKGAVTFECAQGNFVAGPLSTFCTGYGLVENCLSQADGTIIYTVNNNTVYLTGINTGNSWAYNCVQTGKLTARRIEPFYTTNASRIKDCYYDAALVDDPEYYAGTAKTAEQLRDASQYTGWSTEIWDMAAMPSLKTLSGASAVVDKNALNTQLTAAKALMEGDYTPESWQALNSAITAAEEVAGRATASYKEVENQITALETAVQGMVRLEADKTALNAKLTEAKIITASGNAGGQYTEESYAVLVKAIAAAQATADKADALKSEVDAQTAALTAAVEGLKTKALPGDVNGDGFVDEADAAEVLRYSAKLSDLSDAQKAIGDVNGDGTLDEVDAGQILRYAAKLIDQFEQGKENN